MRHDMLLRTTAHISKPCWPLCDFPIGEMLWRVTDAERRQTSRVRLRTSLRNCSSGKPINNSQELLRPRHQRLRVVTAALQSSLKQSGQAILSLGRSICGGSSPLRHLVAVGLYPRSEFLETTRAGRPTSHMHRGRLLRAAADVNKPRWPPCDALIGQILKRTTVHPRSTLLPRHKTYTEMATARRTRMYAQPRKLSHTAVV